MAFFVLFYSDDFEDIIDSLKKIHAEIYDFEDEFQDLNLSNTIKRYIDYLTDIQNTAQWNLKVWKYLQTINEKANNAITQLSHTNVTKNLLEIKEISENLNDFIFKDEYKDHRRLYPIMEKEKLLIVETREIIELREFIDEIDERISKFAPVGNIQKLNEDEMIRLDNLIKKFRKSSDFLFNNTSIEIPAA